MKIWNALSLGSILIASAACRGQAIAPPALPAAVLAADPTPAATTVPHAATAADTTPVWQRRFDR